MKDAASDQPGKKTLPENEVKDLLKKYNIPTTKYVVVQKENELDKINLSYPLAVKVCSPNILHKTDVGGVKLSVQNFTDLKSVFKEMRSKFPKENILIESMEKTGLEIIVGVINDQTFGLSLMVGLGGIFTEVFSDVSFRVIPITKNDAEGMLGELKGKKLLEGYRGIKVNRGAVVNLLLSTSKLAEDFEGKLDQMDLNPVFARENDVCVVDAKMILRA
jgi:acyl-CoA synthetase (NDP forming)